MWLWLAIPIVAYLLYRVFQFATADADNALCSKRLKAGYLHGKVVWITGASSGSKCTFLYFLSQTICERVQLYGGRTNISGT